MTQEEIVIRISAEDQATKVIETIAQSVSQLQTSFKGVGKIDIGGIDQKSFDKINVSVKGLGKSMIDLTGFYQGWAKDIDNSIKPIKENVSGFMNLNDAVKFGGLSMKDFQKWQKQTFFTMDNGIGLTNALTGDTLSYGRAVQLATIQNRRFKMEWLSIMFAGMALSRAFGSIVKSQENLWGITAMMDAMWTTVMSGPMSKVSDLIADITSKIEDLPPDTQMIIGLTVLGLKGLGDVLTIIGELFLGAMGLKMLFPELTITFATVALFLLKFVAGVILAIIFIKGLDEAISSAKDNSIPGFINGISVMVIALAGLAVVLGLLPLAVAGPLMIIFWTIAFVAANWKKMCLAMEGYWEMFGVGVMRVTVGILKALNTITFGSLNKQVADAESRLQGWEDALAGTTESYHEISTVFPIYEELKSLFTTTTKAMDDMQTTVDGGFKDLSDNTKQNIGNMTSDMSTQLDIATTNFGVNTEEMGASFTKLAEDIKSNSGDVSSTVQTEWTSMNNLNVEKTKSTVNQINKELENISKDINTTVTTTHVIKAKYDLGVFNSIAKLLHLPGYAMGGLVPETGPAILHKGEQVIPANQVGSGQIIFSPATTINANVSSSYDVRQLADELNKYWAQDFQRMMRSRGSI